MEGMPHHEPVSPNIPPAPRQVFTIEDIDDAREHVSELIEQGIRPQITVPAPYAEEIQKEGIHVLPKADGITGRRFSFIAGTIGVDPLAPSTEERYLFSVDPSRTKVEPRLTGSDNAFHGVVQFPNGISAGALTRMGKFTGGIFYPEESGDTKEPLH